MPDPPSSVSAYPLPVKKFAPALPTIHNALVTAEAFTFSELEGSVPALSLPASATPGVGYQLNTTAGAQPAWDRSREPQQLRVFFKPKVQGEYHCRFRFQVTCGESIDLELYGFGSVDEQHRQRS